MLSLNCAASIQVEKAEWVVRRVVMLSPKTRATSIPEAAQHVQYSTKEVHLSIRILSDIYRQFLWNIPS